MPTDAKCGLFVGVGVVVAMAIVFFQSEPPAAMKPLAAKSDQSRARSAAE